jgi:hypothetical protein
LMQSAHVLAVATVPELIVAQVIRQAETRVGREQAGKATRTAWR